MRYLELGVALFAGCVIGWLWGERPELLRSFSLLEAMTAYGTVGAVWVALWQARKLERIKFEEDRKKIEGLLSIVNEAICSLAWVADHLSVKSKANFESVSVTELRAFMHSATQALNIPFYESPFCRAHGALLFCLSDLQSAMPLIERAIDEPTAELVGYINEVSESANRNLDFAFTFEALHGYHRPSPPYFLSRNVRVQIAAVQSGN